MIGPTLRLSLDLDFDGRPNLFLELALSLELEWCDTKLPLETPLALVILCCVLVLF
jgi:hypothetical protein